MEKSSSFQLSLLLWPRVRGFKTYNFQAFLDTETLLKNFQIVLKFISFKSLLLQKSATAALQKYRGVALAMGSEVRNVGRSSCLQVSLYLNTLLGGVKLNTGKHEAKLMILKTFLKNLKVFLCLKNTWILGVLNSTTRG